VTRRTWATIIFVVWAGSLGWLAKRELFRSTSDRLAAAALAVPPGTDFYRLDLGGQQVGMASTTWDTLGPRLRITDLLLLSMPAGARVTHARARTSAIVNRALRLDTLDVVLDVDNRHLTAHGAVTGDSVLILTVSAGPLTQSTRVTLHQPLVLPSVLPLRLALGGALKTGRSVSMLVFDPLTLSARDVAATIAAETTFVVTDSAGFDSTTMAWTAARLDTVRSFEIDELAAGRTTRTWVDADGRLVAALSPAGFGWTRSAYEIAYDNFRAHPPRAVASRRDTVLASTAREAGLTPTGSGSAELRLRVRRLDLNRLTLAGGRQELRGDTLVVRREDTDALTATYKLPAPPPGLAPWLTPEPLIPSAAPSVVAQARTLLGRETDPGRAARLLLDWVSHHVHPGVGTPLPVALAALAGQPGDCNEAVALYVSLARALGLPARAAAGLLDEHGRFYYHAWAEVYLGAWVAVDPLLDQMPADAGHVRFAVGAFADPFELVRVIGRVGLDIL